MEVMTEVLESMNNSQEFFVMNFVVAFGVAEVAVGQDTARSTGSRTTQRALPVHSVLVLLPSVWLIQIQYIL